MPWSFGSLGGSRLWGLAGLAGLTGALVLHAWHPLPGVQNTVCLLRHLLGIPCPGCGMTRAFACLAKGEWAAAAAANPLAYPLAAELLGAWAAWGVALARRRAWRLPTWIQAHFGGWTHAHAAILIAFWLGRAATGTLPW